MSGDRHFRGEDAATPETSEPARPQLLHGGRSRQQPGRRVANPYASDPRVSMVLAVLGGQTIEDVAAEWDVESSLVHRWVGDFLVAGSGMITNRPDPDEARQRDRFLAALAHELRTPLAVANGWAMALAQGAVPEENLPTAVEKMNEALARLSDLVLDVELTATVSLGRARVEIEPVDVGALCSEIPGSPPVRHGADLRVNADPKLLVQVLRDLLACAHRDPAPDSVTIDVVETGSWHEIRVVREGHPIGPMIIKALFDPFGSNDDTTGVTLGLYLARALTVAQGGFLGAEGDDDITVLLVRLPREPALYPAPQGSGVAAGEGGDR